MTNEVDNTATTNGTDSAYNGTIEIETGFEVPLATRNTRYPWVAAAAEVGNSFFAPIDPKGASSRAYVASKRYGVHFIGRAATKDGVDGTRFYHIAAPLQSRK